VHRWRNVAAKLPKQDIELHVQVEAAYWGALDEASSPADGEAGLRRLVADLERQYPTAAACLAENLPSLSGAVLDLSIASARGLGLTALEHRQLARMRAVRMAETPETLTA
jgi:hypothetical protein